MDRPTRMDVRRTMLYIIIQQHVRPHSTWHTIIINRASEMTYCHAIPSYRTLLGTLPRLGLICKTLLNRTRRSKQYLRTLCVLTVELMLNANDGLNAPPGTQLRLNVVCTSEAIDHRPFTGNSSHVVPWASQLSCNYNRSLYH
jgi:hypothetical protein